MITRTIPMVAYMSGSGLLSKHTSPIRAKTTSVDCVASTAANFFSFERAASVAEKNRTGDQSFEINCDIGEHYSFPYVIIGNINPGPKGSTIAIRIQPTSVAIILFGIWLVLTVAFAVNFSNANEGVPWQLFMVAIISYLVAIALFQFETRKAKKFLLSLLDAEET